MKNAVTEEGESPLEAAKRELQEATGVRKISGQNLDRTEDLEVCLLDKNDVLDLLLNDQVKQALMAAPLWRYFAELER